MRLHWLAGLTLLAFITRIGADTSVTDPPLPESDLSDSACVFSTTRFLRASPVDDEERAGLSVPAIEKVKTAFASPVGSSKLQAWLNKGKPAEVVFARMKLDKAGDYLFSSSNSEKLTQWLKYADDLSVKNPTKGTSAISTLIKQYDDAGLYKMIESAMEVPRTKELATKLHNMQMQHWMATAKSPDDVFHLMRPDHMYQDVLGNSKFTAWAKYVDDFNSSTALQPSAAVP